MSSQQFPGQYRRVSLLLSQFLLALAFVCGVSHAEIGPGSLPGISGMALIEEGVYLTAHDVKSRPEGEEDTATRLGILKVSEGIPVWEALECDWSVLAGELPNDLEAVCALAGTPNTYLAVESSYHKARFGRIITVEVVKNGDSWAAQAKHFQHFPETMPGTGILDNIEGAWTIAHADGIYLLLGKRGKNDKYARVYWGKFDPSAKRFRIDKNAYDKFNTPFAALDVPGDKRYCSDLFVDSKNRLYAVSCNDPGDSGPFYSRLYSIGTVSPTGTPVRLHRTESTEIVKIDGHKIEALAAPNKAGDLCVAATDDEDFRGTYFTLGVSWGGR